MKLLSILADGPMPRETIHSRGMPPELKGGMDTRQKMPNAKFLIIRKEPEGVFLYRYDQLGQSAGDTWHADVDEAKNQAQFEFGKLVEDWQEISPTVGNEVEYAIALAAGSRP